MISEAKKAYDRQDFEDALNIYQRILQQEPANLDALQGLARTYYQLRLDAQALDCCLEALKSDGTLIWPHLVRSYVYYRQKKIEDSNKEASIALEAAPSDWEPNFWWGTLLLHENKIEDGIKFLEKAVSFETQNWYLYNNLAIAYEKKGEIKKYFDALNQMNRLRPRLIFSTLIYLGNIARYAIWVLLAHYLLIILSLMFKLQILLIIPIIISVLWIISGVVAFSQNKKIGIMCILLGIINSLSTVWAFRLFH